MTTKRARLAVFDDFFVSIEERTRELRRNQDFLAALLTRCNEQWSSKARIFLSGKEYDKLRKLADRYTSSRPKARRAHTLHLAALIDLAQLRLDAIAVDLVTEKMAPTPPLNSYERWMKAWLTAPIGSPFPTPPTRSTHK